jgi:hypothetical protein
MLSIVMIKSPTLLISVLNTRTAGISNGTVTCAFFIEAIHLCDHFCTILPPPHLGGTTAFPNERIYRALQNGHSRTGFTFFRTVCLVKLNRFSRFGRAQAQVEHLYKDRETHGKIDISFRDVLVQTLYNQRETNQQQE